MISFEPTEDQVLMRDAVAQFAKSALRTRVRDFERRRAIPEDIQATAHELGCGMIALPESVGGQGQGMTTAVLLDEEIAAADAAAAFSLGGPGPLGLAVAELASEAQAREILAEFAQSPGLTGAVAWSELAPCKERAGFVTTAEKTTAGYVLRGKKSFVANAAAAHRFVVFAQVDPEQGWDGIGAFVVDRADSGVTVLARHDTLGLNAAWFGEVEFSDVIVPETRRLTGGDGDQAFLRAVLRFFSKHGLLIAARAVGVSRCAFDLAREYCDTRKAFGKPIGHFQAVAFALSDRLMDLESSRWLVWRAASAWDGNVPERDALVRTAQAVSNALEAAMRITDDGVSLHGGAGFMRDVLAEKLMRDEKQLAVCSPTAEHFDQLATALELGCKLDAALVLPTPDSQAIFT